MDDAQFFIDDGYFEQGHIDALSGVHGPLDFVFRPMIHADKEAYFAAARAPGATPSAVMAQFVAEHVRSWSLARPLDSANLQRLRPRLLERLFHIVMGESASDLTLADREAADLKN
ncbi:MAG: hypothetical protein ACIALR_11455 [Blastopirellula sp. JB062]